MTDLRPRVPNISALRKRLKCDYSYLWWVLSGKIPPRKKKPLRAGPQMAMAIERETGGAIKRGDLRPDIWPDHVSPSVSVCAQ